MSEHRVAAVADVPVGGVLMVSVGLLEVGLFRVGEEIVAWRNHCPHMAAPVCQGRVTHTRLPSPVYCYQLGLEDQVLQCPWHGWEFDLLTGRHLAAGSHTRLRGYPVEVRDGEVFIRTRT